MSDLQKKLIVLSSPSGGGKSTVARYILDNFTDIKFSISCTTRSKREKEIDGKDYFFLTKEEFKLKLESDEFAENEEIFGNLYGTLKSEINKQIEAGNRILFDIDVKGAISLKKIYQENSILIFLKPPSLTILEERLRGRGTETDEQIARRIARAESEMEELSHFDFVIENNVLQETFKKVTDILC